MKLSISTPQSCAATANTASNKLHDENNNLFEGLDTNLLINSCYEPTSVLDIQHSPSHSPVPPSDHSTIADVDKSDGWDSILSELGFSTQLPDDDDFPAFESFDHSFSTINHQYEPCFPDIQDVSFGPIYEPGIIDDLLLAAQCFESGQSHQLQVILSRLNQRLRSPVGKPLQRAAYYFKETLIRLVAGPTQPAPLSSLEVVNTIQALKVFSAISPISLFSDFSANQAILEAVDGSVFIHIIDFDIEFGGHWASFMRELVEKSEPNKRTSIVLRVTAIVPDAFRVESDLVRENLTQFASELGLNFYMDFVTFQNFEKSSFESVMFMEGERVAVHLTPNALHKIADSNSSVSKFLDDLRQISPRVVAMTDREAGINIEAGSFSMSFAAAMEFYTGVLESLDAAVMNGGDWVGRIEMFVIQPRIMAVMKAAATVGRRRMTWREAFGNAGIKAVGFSRFADSQAEWLLRNTRIGGFHVARRDWEMVLCWHDKALVATSAWRC